MRPSITASLALPLLLAACASNDSLRPFSPPTAVPRQVSSVELCQSATFAATLPAGAAITSATRGTTPLPHCRLRGTITTQNPGPNTINFSLTLPDTYNGRYAYEAPGGPAGVVMEPTPYLLSQGYAMATSSQGTRPAFGLDYTWRNDPAQLLDYNHRGVHVTSQITQKLAQTYYGGRPVRYLVGCSGGGWSGRNNMRNYGTEDFDGVLASAPPTTASNSLWMARISQYISRNPSSWMSPAQVRAAEAKIIATYDGADGVVDGIIQDERLISFDSSILRDVLTPAQIALVDFIRADYPHLANPAPSTNGGRTPGPTITKLSEWIFWHAGSVPPPWKFTTPGAPAGFMAGVSTMRAIYGDNFDFVTGFDFSNPQDFQKWVDSVGDAGGASGYDYSKFPRGNGKSIFYNGGGDSTVPFRDTLVTRNEMKRYTPDLDTWNKVYIVGGWGHCAPGPDGRGPSTEQVVTKTLQALVEWVELGREPQAVTVERPAAATLAARSFLLCAEPARAVYRGTGDINSSANWSCRTS